MSYQNLGDFLEKNSKKNSGRTAYEIKRGFRTQRFKFEDIYKFSLKTAQFLKNKGLKKEDKVAIWSANMPEYPIAYFSCWLLGITVVPIDIRTTQDTLKIFLTKANCKVGFKSRFIPENFGSLVKQTFILDGLIDLVKDLPLPKNLPQVNPLDLAEIAFTSGTTGIPKGVILTHQNFLSAVSSLTLAFPFKSEYKALSILPLSHAFETTIDFLVAYLKGIKVTYLERINRLTILKALQKGKITSMAVVPQLLQLLMTGIEAEVENMGKQKIWQKLNYIAPQLPIFIRRLIFRKVHQKLGGSLRFFGCGSAPLNLKLAQKWENLGTEIYEGYGATETAAALSINTPQLKKLGSVGKVLSKIEVKIDPDSKEILVSGPNVSPGYFEDEQNSKHAFHDGWYNTGDIGKIDKDGYIFITGREAFRIVLPNGQKVYPEDLEKKLNSHPDVKESCVIGVKRDEDEIVHAVIITKLPKKMAVIIKSVNQKLASHEQIMESSLWPEDDFPRTPILKIDRRKVAEYINGIKEQGSTVQVKSEDKLFSLITQVSKIASNKIKESSVLASDLKMDSLQRVEFLSLIEQEFAVEISETLVTQHTTVEDVRKLIKQSPQIAETLPVSSWIYNPLMGKIRVFLQNILAFPLHSLFVPIKVEGIENIKNLQFPVIFYFNHIGVLDGMCVLRILPNQLREALVIAATSDLWKDYRKNWVEIFGGAIPFDKKEKIKASLEMVGEFLDNGFSIVLAPEGTFSPQGKMLKFKPGIGLMATQMQVLVVPVKIDPAYLEIFPPMGGSFWENLPKKRKEIWIKVGKPLIFDKNTSFDEATQKMQQTLEDL